MTIAVADDLDRMFLAAAVLAFFVEWGSFPITLRIVRLDPETLAEALRSGFVAFAIGWEQEFASGCSVERLEPYARWQVLVALVHKLANCEREVTADDLTDSRVFLTPLASSSPSLAALLRSVPATHRIEVESVKTAQAMVTAGLGIGLDVSFASAASERAEPFRRLPVAGVEPKHLCLYLPKNPDDLSDPGKYLIETVRRAVREIGLPPIPAFEAEQTELPEILPPVEPIHPFEENDR